MKTSINIRLVTLESKTENPHTKHETEQNTERSENKARTKIEKLKTRTIAVPSLKNKNPTYEFHENTKVYSNHYTYQNRPKKAIFFLLENSSIYEFLKRLQETFSRRERKFIFRRFSSFVTRRVSLKCVCNTKIHSASNIHMHFYKYGGFVGAMHFWGEFYDCSRRLGPVRR